MALCGHTACLAICMGILSAAIRFFHQKIFDRSVPVCETYIALTVSTTMSKACSLSRTAVNGVTGLWQVAQVPMHQDVIKVLSVLLINWLLQLWVRLICQACCQHSINPSINFVSLGPTWAQQTVKAYTDHAGNSVFQAHVGML